MKKIYALFFLFVALLPYPFLNAEQRKDFEVPKLSSVAQVSLLTIGLGAELYQLFGHTAIRIKDSIRGWDFVYNYGTFDFSDPDFLKKFIKGELLYYESIDIYSNFYEDYKEQNRTIHEQIFILDSTQKQKIFDFLTINAREENKYYWYDFLFDNCATRPRDIISKVTFQNKLKYEADADDESTFRELIDRHNTNEWLDFGMDLLIGLPTDKRAGYGRTFIPFELMQLYDGATADGKKVVLSNTLILDAIPQHVAQNWITPDLVFWFLFVLVLIINIKTNSNIVLKTVGIGYLSILGIIGCFLLFMWFGTSHVTTKWNLNILWAMPFNLPLALFLFRKKIAHVVLNYFKFYRVLLILLLCFWWLNPQEYHSAVVPLILLALFFVSKFLPIPTRKN